MENFSNKNDAVPGRRSFIRTAAAGAAVAATVAGAAKPAQAAPAKRLRIGAAGVGEYSFTSFCWSDIIAPDNPPTVKTAPSGPRSSTWISPMSGM